MLHAAAFMSAIFAACLVLKRRFEQILPMVTLSAMLALTALAMLGQLLWVDALAAMVIAAAVLALLFALATRRIPLRGLCCRFVDNALTPCFACFVLLAAFFLYATEPMVVWFNDDLAYWALEPKSLWIFSGLVSGAQHLNPIFATYTPGVQVLQWWGMHALGEWREGTLYFVLFMSYAVFLLPLFSRLRWKHAWAIPLVCVVIVTLPVLGNSLSYTFLSVDTALGLCFGYTLAQAWQCKKGDFAQWLSIALGLCGLALIKQIGLLFAALAVALLMLRRGKKGLLLLIPPLLVWGAWMLYCGKMGLTGFHTSGLFERVAEMLQGTYVPPVGIDGIGASLWHSLTRPFTTALYCKDILFYTSPWVYIPKALQLLALIVLPCLVGRVSHQKALTRATVFFAALTAGYLLLQYASFFTVFYHETDVYVYELQDNMLMLMERYLAPLMLGMGMLALSLLADAFPRQLAATWRWLPHTVAVALAATLVFLVNWSVLYETLLPERYLQKDRAIGAEGVTLMDHDWGYELDGYENAHVLTGLETNSDFIKNLQYTFAPTKFEFPEPAFTESAEALDAYLRENRITHVILFDEASALYAPASALAEDGDLYPWTLYEVENAEDGIVLSEFY